MRKVLGGLTVATVIALTAYQPVSAQSVIILGGGVTIPTGDFDFADPGFMIDGGIGFPVGEGGLEVAVLGSYGSNNHEDSDDKTNLFGAAADLVYSFHEPGEAGLFVFGGPGILWHQFSPDDGENDTDSAFAVNGGAGLSFPLGGVGGWVIGRYVHGFFDEDDTTLFGFSAGITIALGGDGM